MIATAAASAAYLLLPATAPLGARLALLMVSTVAYLVALVATARGAPLARGLIVGAVVVAAVVAVATPPRMSQDAALYTMQGRVIVEHRANPYLHRLDEFAQDPWLDRVAPVWRDDAALYGPSILAVHAAGSVVAGDSLRRGQLFFQLVGAASLGAALLIVSRVTIDAGALVFLGLNPALLVRTVNEGHNDLAVGLALLGAVVLADRRRWRLAGLLVGLAALAKVPFLLAALALVAWAGVQGGRAAAGRLAASAGATVLLGYLAVGGLAALEPLQDAAGQTSRSSVWTQVRQWLVGSLIDRGWRGVDAGTSVDRVLSLVSLAIIAGLVVVVVVALRRQRHPGPAVGGALAGHLLLALYTVPWYAGGAVPVLATCRRHLVAWVVAAWSCLVLFAYEYEAELPRGGGLEVLRSYSIYGQPVVQVVLAGVLAGVAVAALRRSDRLATA